MGVLNIMGRSGHRDVAWDPAIEAEVAEAREAFRGAVEDLCWAAFKVTPATQHEGQETERIEAFDPGAERIVLVPPIAGG